MCSRLSGDTAKSNSSGCWEFLNVLGDLFSPPRDSGAVPAFLDAGVCSGEQRLKLPVFTPFLCHYLSWWLWCMVHICPLGLRTQGSRDVGMAHCQAYRFLPPSSLVPGNRKVGCLLL